MKKLRADSNFKEKENLIKEDEDRRRLNRSHEPINNLWRSLSRLLEGDRLKGNWIEVSDISSIDESKPYQPFFVVRQTTEDKLKDAHKFLRKHDIEISRNEDKTTPR